MTDQDFEQVMQIERQSFSDPYPRILMKLLIQSSPGLFIVATTSLKNTHQTVKIIGYAGAQILRQEHHRIGHIISLAVKPVYRRKGTGTHLMRELIQRLQNNNCAQIRLEVRITNEAALTMYAKLGFQQVDIIPGYYKGGEDAALLELDLEDAQ